MCLPPQESRLPPRQVFCSLPHLPAPGTLRSATLGSLCSGCPCLHSVPALAGGILCPSQPLSTQGDPKAAVCLLSRCFSATFPDTRILPTGSPPPSASPAAPPSSSAHPASSPPEAWSCLWGCSLLQHPVIWCWGADAGMEPGPGVSSCYRVTVPGTELGGGALNKLCSERTRHCLVRFNESFQVDPPFYGT